MNIEIINVGTELLLGEIVNTNAVVLEKMCRNLGFNVYHQSVVGDNEERFLECLDIAFKRGADCVITTGGLGPTEDDVTKELSAQYLGLELVYNEEEADKVFRKCDFLGLYSGYVAPTNFKQAYYPKDCYILENEVGTANGCIMEKNDKMIINLPGPPKEMNYVVEHVLYPYLLKYQKETIYTYDINTMFIGESQLALVLDNLVNKQVEVTIALYAQEGSVRVRLGVKAINKEEADKRMAPVIKEIYSLCENYIVDEDIHDALMKVMVSYQIVYDGDFRLQDDFLEGQFLSDDPSLILTLKTEDEPLGEILEIIINDELRCRLPLLKKAQYSYTKAVKRIMVELYTYLKNEKTHTFKK